MMMLSVSVDRPALTKDEIVVTPEMIEAGAEAMGNFYLGDGTYDLSDSAIKACFRAMVDAFLRSNPPRR
jgi:hypothetical protein